MSRRDDELPLSPERPVADDVRGELAEHIRLRTEELMAEGWTPEAAKAEALRAFGDLQGIERECAVITERSRRGRHRAARLETLLLDVMFAWRILRKDRSFTMTAALTLALGIGANTAIFSLVNSVLLRPLPYERPEQLVTIAERHENGWGNIPWPNFLDLQQQARSFSAMASYGAGAATIIAGGEAMRANAASVSEAFFRVFPLQPFLGRLPGPGDHQRGTQPVAVISYDFWRTRLGAPASLDSVRLRTSLDYAVIGVLPPGFDFPYDSDIWVPLELGEQSLSRTAHNWESIGRLKERVPAATAEQELDDIFAGLSRLHQPDFDATGAILTPLQEQLTGSVRTPLLILLGASALLLLAACTNLASSMLARGTGRAQEFAVRAALGAGRGRLVRQVLTEAVMLSLIGAAAGIAVAVVLLRALASRAPATLPMESATLDGRVLVFALLASLLTAVLFGLLPALRLSQNGAADAMRTGRSSAGRGRLRAWHVLVAVEAALTVVLLTGSALLMRSWAEVMRTDLGFRPDSVLTVAVHLPSVNYGARPLDVARFHERAITAISRIPGVRAAGLANRLPLQGFGPSGGMEVEGKPHDPRGPFTGFSIYRVVSGGFFDAAGMRLLAGRTFGPGDDAQSPPVVVVNRTFAEREWPGEDPLGRRVRAAGMDGPDGEPFSTVIGVVDDVRHGAPTSAFGAAYYFDHRQRPSWRTQYATYAIRTGLAPGSIVPQVRAALADIDPLVPAEFATMEEVVSRTVADRRFTMLVLSTFAMAALLLAGVGIFGVVAYAVARRTREIGVRLALGAKPADVTRLMQGAAMRAVLIGLVAGVLGSLLFTRVLRSILFGVSALDPAAFLAAAAVLGTVAWLASLLPARRATRIDPQLALRAE